MYLNHISVNIAVSQQNFSIHCYISTTFHYFCICSLIYFVCCNSHDAYTKMLQKCQKGTC